MASNSSKKNKSSGLRMLWIPGRKSHPKGHYSSTTKHVSYSASQKKSEVWTLGGSRAQSELIDLWVLTTKCAYIHPLRSTRELSEQHKRCSRPSKQIFFDYCF